MTKSKAKGCARIDQSVYIYNFVSLIYVYLLFTAWEFLIITLLYNLLTKLNLGLTCPRHVENLPEFTAF